MMLKKVIAVAAVLPFVASAALAEGCNSQKMTQQTPMPVAAAPQTPVPADPVKVEVAEAPKTEQTALPKTN
jgi:hypothetical protein